MMARAGNMPLSLGGLDMAPFDEAATGFQLANLPVENRGIRTKLPVMYQSTTEGIRVTVQPHFLEGQTRPEESRYVWAYTVTVENLGSETVTLLTRHWVITDGQGRRQDVRGDGVVGEQPTLAPGQRFQYTSGCPLNTPSGLMVGSYGMVSASGRTIEVAIPAFSLDSPHDQHSVN
jgi:ApaG protein